MTYLNYIQEERIQKHISTKKFIKKSKGKNKNFLKVGKQIMINQWRKQWGAWKTIYLQFMKLEGQVNVGEEERNSLPWLGEEEVERQRQKVSHAERCFCD